MWGLVPKDDKFKDVYVGDCGGAATFIQIRLSPQGTIQCSTASLQRGPGLGVSSSAPIRPVSTLFFLGTTVRRKQLMG